MALFKAILVLTLLTVALSSTLPPKRFCYITSNDTRYGNIYHYGIYHNLDLLEFSKFAPASPFYYLSNGAFQDVETYKCINPITTTNLQLVLTDNCVGAGVSTWYYDSITHCLMNRQTGKALSPRNYPRPPADVYYVPGLSDCSTYNEVYITCYPLSDKKMSV